MIMKWLSSFILSLFTLCNIYSNEYVIYVDKDSFKIRGDTSLFYNKVYYELVDFNNVHWVHKFKSNGTYLYDQADYYLITEQLLKAKLRIRKRKNKYIYLKFRIE